MTAYLALRALADGDPSVPTERAKDMAHKLGQLELRVLSLSVIGRWADLLNAASARLRIPRLPIPPGIYKPKLRVAALSIATLPAIIYIGRTVVPWSSTDIDRTTLLWLSYFAVIVWLGNLAAIRNAKSLRDTADTILTPVMADSDIDRLDKLVSRYMSRRLQWATTLAATISVLVVFGIVSPEFADQISIVPESYLAVGLATFYGTNAIYWMFVGTRFTQIYARSPSLRLAWLNPAETPGVRALSGLLGRTAMTGAIGILAYVFAMWSAFDAAGAGGSGTLAAATLYIGSVIGIVLFATWAVVPQAELSRTIGVRRRDALTKLSSALNFHLRSVDQNSHAPQLAMDAYGLIRDSRRFTVRGETLVEYVVVALTLAVSVILPIVAS